MASRTTSRSITLRVGQDEKIRKWYREKFFQISGYFQDCIEILEKRPELLDTVRPGLELSRALDRAEEFERLLKDIRDEADAAHQNDRPMDMSDLTSVIDMVLNGAPRER